ncbi:MAG: glucose dehydrogenase, partial [Gemmatimonadetes bacterium]|nr:glucose dehydrogenase [Gemmatimonadota bacterium]
VTGGLVYRGAAIAELVGHYLYSDFCAGFLRSFRFDGAEATDLREWEVGELGPVVSFGEDGFGEIYIVSGDGTVFRLISG